MFFDGRLCDEMRACSCQGTCVFTRTKYLYMCIYIYIYIYIYLHTHTYNHNSNENNSSIDNSSDNDDNNDNIFIIMIINCRQGTYVFTKTKYFYEGDWKDASSTGFTTISTAYLSTSQTPINDFSAAWSECR